MLIGFYQLVAPISTVYEVRLPDDVEKTLDIMAAAVSLGINVGLEATPLECLGLGGYSARVAFWIVLPIVLIALIAVAAAVQDYVQGARGAVAAGTSRCRRVLLAAAPRALQLLFLVYPIVTREAFRAFPCHEFVDGSSFLIADVNIACPSPEHDSAKSIAILAILLYPVGTLVFFAALLFAARPDKKPNSDLSDAIAFLHREYKPAFFWWELMEMLRRFLLVGVFIVVEQGTVDQIAYGTLVAVIFTVLQLGR